MRPPIVSLDLYGGSRTQVSEARDQPDCQSRWLQPLEALALLTASAAGICIGLSFRDQRFQQLEPSGSPAETNSSSCWEHWSQFLRPMAPAAGTIVAETNSCSCWENWNQLLRPTAPDEAKDCRQLLEPRPTAPAAGPLVLAPAANGPSYWEQWSHLLKPRFSSAEINISTWGGGFT
ncbi:hypothetical protein PCANC_26765 [Puccinia coronata f. sp. avenae]|uniref:Uncharacterized protein n=1 Tax=Puccinia coronata f. sp. avenae TaxID=200324 RepID=A0A2N5TLS4_9BASI|nr:hypothetical protein PCANC_26765 [Puccinia coronata f. sp. avenae]